MSIRTFKQLYEFLQTYEEKSIRSWLDEQWEGKDKQESLLRLFTGLDLIVPLYGYTMCSGNYNKGSIQMFQSKREIFLNEKNKLILLKDKGDASDLTCMNGNTMLVTTSKNKKDIQSGKLDVEKILFIFQTVYNTKYKLKLCIAIRNKKEYHEMLKNMEKSSIHLKTILKEALVLDWSDLDRAYQEFKRTYATISFKMLCEAKKEVCVYKVHQRIAMQKTLSLKNQGVKNVLWGHIPRSGKSYIMAGTTEQDKKENYLVITTAPNETVNNYLKVFDCIQLQDFRVIELDGKNKTPVLGSKNIIVCSKQFLQEKILKKKRLPWLEKLPFDIRFIDESHNGGTTTLAKSILDTYGKDAFTVHITASYLKPVHDFEIPREHHILWDLEDVLLCKKGDIERLVEKHGYKDLFSEYTPESLQQMYANYPELSILTTDLSDEMKHNILQKTSENEYGWSTEACFLLKQHVENEEKCVIAEFQKEEETLKLWYRIFGKRDEYGIPDKDYPDDTVMMKRIEKICKNPSTPSRWFREGEPMVIMAFLPQDNIEQICLATEQLLTKHNVIPEFEILRINSKVTQNPKQDIEDAEKRARHKKKKGVLVLSGKQCSLGVTIPNCDIVLLLNDNTSFDMIYQMMFRCMTEGVGKNFGFVIDLNIHRVLETILYEYGSLVQPDKHPRDGFQYLLQERIINLNPDKWMQCFGHSYDTLQKICNNMYEIFTSNTDSLLKRIANNLFHNPIHLSKEDQTLLNSIHIEISKSVQPKQEKTQIKKGIEKILVEKDGLSVKSDDDSLPNNVDINEIVKHLVMLICILSIKSDKTTLLEMYSYVKQDDVLHGILMEQTKSWWGKKITSNQIKNILSMYNKYMKDDKEKIQIIRMIKELFQKSLHDPSKLSQLIDEYFIPHELEKKKNAEVSTPYSLRQEMLDTIPIEFWTSPTRVFEPCCGKGGFVIDIIQRFMVGLKDVIPDEKKRYKTIVERCLYFADINPTNIFITKMLVDPADEYTLNVYEGDTLNIDIQKIFGFKMFDAVIGNPPYHIDMKTKQGPAKPLYHLFTETYIDKTNFLLFVIPSRWMVAGLGMKKFRANMLNRTDLIFIRHFDNASVFFSGVDIKGGVCYFLKSSTHKGPMRFNGVIVRDLNKFDVLIDPQFIPIVSKVLGLPSIVTLCAGMGGSYTGINTNDKRLTSTISDSDDFYKCYVSKQKGDVMYIKKNSIKERDFSKWKVFTTRAAHKGGSGFGNMFVGKPNEICNHSFTVFEVSSEQEAYSLLSYLKTQFVNVLLSLRKVTHDVTPNTLLWIPVVPLNQIWTDTSVYEHFKLTTNEISLCEQKVVQKPK
jgi:hypothetical protein